MSFKVITQTEFQICAARHLQSRLGKYDMVTGPGRSGAIAGVYASYILRIPMLQYGQRLPNGKRLLIVDTAESSGATLRKASRRYNGADTLAYYKEPPRIHFWFEFPGKFF